jgi:hypothetical protein
MPRWLMCLGCGSCLLVGELVPPLHYVLLGAGLPSVGLCSLPLLRCALSLKGEAGVQPRCRRLWWNRHHGLSGQSIL